MRKNVAILALFILAVAPRASAQVNAGEAKLNLNGNLSVGYSDDTTNTAGSDHSIFGAGAANLSGFYYNPGFLSFDVQPFYNQSRLDSTSQSVTAASGVSASAKIFGGSHYGGSVSYSNVYDSSGNFNVPGLANYTTHGNNDVLAANWGLHLVDLPSLNLSFSDGNSSYSVYGANTQGTLHADTFSATTAYHIAGFNLNGGYQYASSKTVTPEFLTAGLTEQSHTGDNSFFFDVGHRLPWNGGISASATRMDISTNYGDTSLTDEYHSSIDTLSGGLSFAPLRHLNVGGNTYYTDNLEGTLYNTLLTSGATVPQNTPQQTSNGLSLTGYANYEMPAQHLNLNAFVERQQQSYLGSSFASDSYNGTASYFNTLLGGSFNGLLGLTRTAESTAQQSMLGVNSSVSYTHPIQRWVLAGAFGYSQDTQTVLIAYTTSGYNYSGSLGRRIGRRSYWGAYANGARSLLNEEAGSVNSSRSYSTSLSVPGFSINGSYSASSGNALLTSTGLVTTPIPVTVLPSSAVVLYNGKSYSVGCASNPVRGLTLSATYAKALSATNSNTALSNNNNENMFFLMSYYVRKLNFNAGYSRLVQGFSLSGTPPATVGAFYVGVSRWFNFF